MCEVVAASMLELRSLIKDTASAGTFGVATTIPGIVDEGWFCLFCLYFHFHLGVYGFATRSKSC